jgi:hypothetical protein
MNIFSRKVNVHIIKRGKRFHFHFYWKNNLHRMAGSHFNGGQHVTTRELAIKISEYVEVCLSDNIFPGKFTEKDVPTTLSSFNPEYQEWAKKSIIGWRPEMHYYKTLLAVLGDLKLSDITTRDV